MEAASHLTKGVALLKTLPATPHHTQQELDLQMALSQELMVTKGYAAPEVEHAYTQALQLCRQIGEPPQLFTVLWGLAGFYGMRAQFPTAHELAEQGLQLADTLHDPTFLLEAHFMMGMNITFRGEFALARAHLESAVSLYRPEYRVHSFIYGQDPQVGCY